MHLPSPEEGTRVQKDELGIIRHAGENPSSETAENSGLGAPWIECYTGAVRELGVPPIALPIAACAPGDPPAKSHLLRLIAPSERCAPKAAHIHGALQAGRDLSFEAWATDINRTEIDRRGESNRKTTRFKSQIARFDTN